MDMWNKWRYNCSVSLKYHTHFFTSVDLTDVIRWPTWAHSSRWSKRTAFRRTVPFRKEEDGAGRRGCARDDVWRQRGHYVRRSSRRSHIGRPSRPLSIDYRRWVKIFFQKKKKGKKTRTCPVQPTRFSSIRLPTFFFLFPGIKRIHLHTEKGRTRQQRKLKMKHTRKSWRKRRKFQWDFDAFENAAASDATQNHIQKGALISLERPALRRDVIKCKCFWYSSNHLLYCTYVACRRRCVMMTVYISSSWKYSREFSNWLLWLVVIIIIVEAILF